MTEGTTTVRKAVAQRREEPRGVAVVREYERQFAEVLPEHIEIKAYIGSALAALRKDPDLLAAANESPARFVSTLTECAELGHVPGSKNYYLTRRREKYKGDNNRDAYRNIIVGIEGYRGVIERMYRSGAVASVIVREVCANDFFQYVEGEMDRPVHEIGGRGTTGADFFGENGDRDRGAMVGVYAYAVLTTGAVSRVVMLSKSDVMAAKARSDAGKQDKGPWATDERAMWWKTAAHRLEPWVPTSAEYRREQLRASVEADNLRHRVNTATGEIYDDDGIVDAEVVEKTGKSDE